jgi:hypothetical protein
MVKVHSKVGGLFHEVDGVVCKKGILYCAQSLQSPNSVLFFSLTLFLPLSTNHVTAQPIGPWAYRRAGLNRKAHLVPLIEITDEIYLYYL